jgi:dTDP-3-amino-2,3,6-trideoxy-4-keto-D-glucose/dTDP-3-amino-3,4,6-trideoxy-alpha-D-glucose/dTDP-2,6-dideoxy-D-kanosamine transaminase
MGIGGLVKKKHPGTFGDLGAFSMHPLKSLNAIGDGGMVVTDDEKLYEWMLKYRNHGMIDRNHIEFWGENFRLQPLQAVVAEVGLKKLKKTIENRNKNALRLDKHLKFLVPFVKTPSRIKDNLETFSLYMGLFKDRDNLMKFLINNNIEVKIHYPIPLHKQKAAKNNCRFDKEKLKNAEYQAKHLLTLPVHQFLSKSQIDFMIDKIYEFYGKPVIVLD